MTSLRMKRLQLANYRCFESLDLALEDDLTVLFAENGGGKTALLTALAMGLAVFQRGAPRSLKLNPNSDPRQRTLDEQGRREPAGPCSVSWAAASGAGPAIEWSTTVNSASGRTTKKHRPILAIDRGERDTAKRLFAQLEARWGETDPALIRAKDFMDWEE